MEYISVVLIVGAIFFWIATFAATITDEEIMLIIMRIAGAVVTISLVLLAICYFTSTI